jgi:hypothetical protein
VKVANVFYQSISQAAAISSNTHETKESIPVKMRSILPLLSLSALLAPVQSLYFYIDGTTPKCFFEELPKDTLVVGHYTAEEYDESRKQWSTHDGLNIYISVDVCLPPPHPPSQTNHLPLL